MEDPVVIGGECTGDLHASILNSPITAERAKKWLRFVSVWSLVCRCRCAQARGSEREMVVQVHIVHKHTSTR